MRGHDEVAGPLPASLHHVDLRRPATVIGEHPERRPHAGANRDLRADFEIAVFLRELALRRQDARDVFIVEQHGFQRGRGAAGDDRENAVADTERVEPERHRRSPGIARIDIDLLLAVPGCLALEIGAVAAPISRFGPGRAAGVMRHPTVAAKADGCRNHRGRSDAATPGRANPCVSILRHGVAKEAGRRLQGELRRRAREVLLCESRNAHEKARDQRESTRLQSVDPRITHAGESGERPIVKQGAIALHSVPGRYRPPMPLGVIRLAPSIPG